ncbi:MAG TPA: alpha-amylase family glycosyl hydrolase [Gemmatimonadaceae bacterium]|nr:alpha-amylase family glycosyl hydrolase [Gemmatimonadaceae bacterium]
MREVLTACRVVAVLAAFSFGCRGHAPAPRSPPPTADTVVASVRDWRRGATCYEIFVRSFFDSDGDGIGDLRGVTEKLDYINDGNAGTDRDLGARCIWLMPVNEASSYHGYDATDYYRVEPDYGTNDDFKRLVVEAHRRGVAVLVDMVLNHVSSEHPWFTEALGDPGAPHRSWFRWATSLPAERGPWGQEVWHKSPVRDEYYYGVFWHGMPDLDYHTPAVREEAKRIAAFWLTEMGVDGFRLDAVPYLVEEPGQQIGTAGTHAFLREYAASIRAIAPDAFTVGEVWDGLDRMLPYYPDQLESYFAFDLSDLLIAAVRDGSPQALLDRYAQFQQSVPDARYSTSLRNHDQTRTLTALGGDIARAKLAATLLLTLPGLPFVYYGEEIGMSGDKPDERLRTPMQWSGSANAGFTRGTPWESLQADWATTSVERQDRDSGSLLDLYRRLIRLRLDHSALGTGDYTVLRASSPTVAAYLRRDRDRVVLVVANMGATSAVNVTLTTPDAALRPGTYTTTRLLQPGVASPLVVAADGRIRGYVPVANIAPLETWILSLEG